MRSLFITLIFFFDILLFQVLSAQIPGDPISPAEAVSMLGKGILFEPQAGDVDMQISAKYKPGHGDLIKNNGFQSVRIRYQGDKNPMMIAISEGPPYDAADDVLLTELESIIDDLLGKGLGVVITFYGLTDDNPGDLEKMTSWWGYVAERFKNKSHKLIFNLFVEPWRLINNPDPQRIADYYASITAEIRKTNPTRLLIYFKVPPADYKAHTFESGTEWFITSDFNPIPSEAGIYYMWDFHVLKPVARDNIRLVEQAWEYMDMTKQVVWSGAWNAKNAENEMWYAEPTATFTTRRLINRGIPSAYLMLYDGHTSLYDAEADRNGNGITEEWLYPGFEKIFTKGPDIWWNMLSNPGFERGSEKWAFSHSNYSIELINEDHVLKLGELKNDKMLITQDATLALKNNGPGAYDVLGYFTSTGSTIFRFIIRGNAGGNAFEYTGSTFTLEAGTPVLRNEKINVNWTGELTGAEFVIEMTGDAAVIDKTGLTRFYYDNPALDITLWPGESVNIDNYSTKSNSEQDINGELRALIKKGVNNNNGEVIALAKVIDTLGLHLDKRFIELLGSGYQLNAAGTQYRVGGYYYGTANAAYRKDVEKYIGGKDQAAYDLNLNLIAEQNKARDYFIINDLRFRELFYDVYRNFPPSVRNLIPIDITVTVENGTLTANEANASAYRWCDCDNLYNPVRGVITRSFTPKVSGNYAVKITKSGYTVISGCYEITAVEVITGFEGDTESRRSKIYPNPMNNNFFNLEVNGDEYPVQAVLFDIQGKVIKRFNKFYARNTGIKANVPSGLYIFKVIYTDAEETFRIIKR